MQADSFKIRTYAEPDYDQVVALWSVVFPNDPPHNKPELLIASKLSVQPDLFFVAVSGDSIVGAVMAGYDGVRGWIYHLAVLDAVRKNDIGRRLMETAVDALKGLGCRKVNLQVRTSNLGVIEFYKKLGFHVDEVTSLGIRL